MSDALIHAVRTNNVSRVKQLMSAGCDLNYADENAMTALLYSCELQSFEMLKLLVDAGASVHCQNSLGHKPIDLAYWYGEFRMGAYTAQSMEMVKYLKRHGA